MCRPPLYRGTHLPPRRPTTVPPRSSATAGERFSDCRARGSWDGFLDWRGMLFDQLAERTPLLDYEIDGVDQYHEQKKQCVDIKDGNFDRFEQHDRARCDRGVLR